MFTIYLNSKANDILIVSFVIAQLFSTYAENLSNSVSGHRFDDSMLFHFTQKRRIYGSLFTPFHLAITFYHRRKAIVSLLSTPSSVLSSGSGTGDENSHHYHIDGC